MSAEMLTATVAGAVDNVQCQCGIVSIEEPANRILAYNPEMGASQEDVLWRCSPKPSAVPVPTPPFNGMSRP